MKKEKQTKKVKEFSQKEQDEVFLRIKKYLNNNFVGLRGLAIIGFLENMKMSCIQTNIPEMIDEVEEKSDENFQIIEKNQNLLKKAMKELIKTTNDNFKVIDKEISSLIDTVKILMKESIKRPKDKLKEIKK